MAHVTVEYTANIRAQADIPGLLSTINASLIAQRGVFPLGGIRSRAVELTDYRMADGAADYAFVHITLKMGTGRDAATKARAGQELFEAIKAHFADLYAQRLLALSMEVCEFDEGGTYKHNNIHARFSKAP
jgi:5-carboxymethyl-2-hydroxymuconate isomerase